EAVAKPGRPTVSMHSDEAIRRAQALFRKEQQAGEGQQAMAEHQAKLDAMREKTARLRALRLARDAAKRPAASTKGAAQYQNFSSLQQYNRATPHRGLI